MKKALASLTTAGLLATSASSAHADIYRCPGPNGSTIYQERPCKGGQHKGSIETRQAKPSTPELEHEAQPTPIPSSSNGEVARQKQFLAERDKLRRKEALNDNIKRNEREIEQAHKDMDRELALLRAQKNQANNNLAGATWEQSISTEMQAVTTRYQTIINTKQEAIRQAREELNRL